MPELNTWVLLAIAGLNAVTAYWAYRTRNQIDVLEKNTNSIKDALVKVTAESSEAKGVLLGRAQAVDVLKDAKS